MSSSLGDTINPLVTVLTPTFNDAGYLPFLVTSMMEQRYVNWQWIIIDDGSTDSTPELLASLTDPRICVLRKENGDQLNALAFAIPHIDGAIVTMMHSDDEFVGAETIAECVLALRETNADGLYGDFQKMDGSGHPSGVLTTPERVTADLARKTVARMGTNFIGDPFFVWKRIFDSHVVPNYIQRNTIYYFDYQGSGTLQLQKVPSWYRYRIFSENYINSDIGKFVALSGQFRTVTRLVNAGVIPSINVLFGYAGFRLTRRAEMYSAWPRLNSASFGTKFFGYWAADLRRYGYPDVLIQIADAIAHSYATSKRCDRPLFWSRDAALGTFAGADARKLFKHFQADGVPAACAALLDRTFDHIVVDSDLAMSQVKAWLEFFSLQYRVIRKQS